MARNIARKLDLADRLTRQSHFLFGPRGTGKSTLIREQLADSVTLIDLLHSETFLRLQSNPSLLEQLTDNKRPTVIDEVQKLPILLDEVHRLIELRQQVFLLTGSSARKLRRGQANLLAGRALKADLFSLTHAELGPDFDLERYLRFGGLPAVYLSPEPGERLWAYCETYLREEIQAEAAVRDVARFGRFLKVAALCHGQVLNYTKLGADAELPPSTVRQHFQILDDTLLSFEVQSWRESTRRKALQSSRIYLFDPGLVNTLAERETLDRDSDTYGRLFEGFIAAEVRAYLSYARRRTRLLHWRSKHGHEVDLLFGEVAVEIKSSRKVSNRDLRGLRALRDEGAHQRFILVSQDPLTRRDGGFEFMHWQEFLTQLWAGGLS